MLFVDAAFVFLVFLLSIPGITGYFASSYGRSFWLWFFLAIALPIVANLVLAVIIRKDIKRQKKLDLAYDNMTRYEDEQMSNQISRSLFGIENEEDLPPYPTLKEKNKHQQ